MRGTTHRPGPRRAPGHDTTRWEFALAGGGYLGFEAHFDRAIALEPLAPGPRLAAALDLALPLPQRGGGEPAILTRELRRVRLVARDEETQVRGLLGPVRDGADLERLLPELSFARPPED